MTSANDRVLAWAPFVLLAGVVAWVSAHAMQPLHDPDSWWHLRLGQDFIDQRSLAAPEHWSTFATASWVPTQPLPEVAMATVERAFGLAGVVWVYTAALVVLVLGVYLLNRRFATPLPASVATTVFVASAEAAITARPQLISYGLLAVFVATWLCSERDLRPRYWLIPLSLLWSLCHGFWFVGVGYGLLAFVGIAVWAKPPRRTLWQLATVAVGSGLVVLLNPVGPGILKAPFEVSARGQYITEWQHTTLTAGPTLVVLGTVAFCVVVWTRYRDEMSVFRVLVACSAAFFAWYAERTTALGGVVMSPLVASALEALVGGSRAASPAGLSVEGVHKRRPATVKEVRGLVLGGVALLALLAAGAPRIAAVPGGDVPGGFDRKLDALPSGTTVLNDYALGGWLAWQHPRLNRWVDGLAEAYPVAHLADVTTVQFQEPGWRRVLARSGATIAIVRDGTARALEGDGWRPIARDRGWVLLQQQ